MSELTFAEMMTFIEEKVEKENDDFDGEIPKHGVELLCSTSTDMLQTLTNCKVAEAENTDYEPNTSEMLAKDCVDVLLALGSVRSEYNLDIETKFEERMNDINKYQELEEAMEDAETVDERMEVLDEHLDEDEIANMMAGGQNPMTEEYDHDESGRGFQ
jgi:hypothetical protein